MKTNYKQTWKELTFWEKLDHWFGHCPKFEQGYNCKGRDGECGYKEVTYYERSSRENSR